MKYYLDWIACPWIPDPSRKYIDLTWRAIIDRVPDWNKPRCSRFLGVYSFIWRLLCKHNSLTGEYISVVGISSSFSLCLRRIENVIFLDPISISRRKRNIIANTVPSGQRHLISFGLVVSVPIWHIVIFVSLFSEFFHSIRGLIWYQETCIKRSSHLGRKL